MNESNPPPLSAPSRNSLGKRLGYKLLIIASCIVLLQIPLFLVESKREERAQRQIDVVREITGTWGEDQLVHGALLAVPVERGQPAILIRWGNTFVNFNDCSELEFIPPGTGDMEAAGWIRVR